MLTITIPKAESYDEVNNCFIETKAQSLTLEHSLVSISKWESRWKVPFLDEKSKTAEQTIDYIKCMTLTQNVDPNVYRHLTRDNVLKINEYIGDSMTATWFSDKKKTRPGRQKITSELIYCWMIEFGIPFECQKWHLSRLLTLIRVCEAENRPKKKASKQDLLSQYASLNAARRKPRR